MSEREQDILAALRSSWPDQHVLGLVAAEYGAGFARQVFITVNDEKAVEETIAETVRERERRDADG